MMFFKVTARQAPANALSDAWFSRLGAQSRVKAAASSALIAALMTSAAPVWAAEGDRSIEEITADLSASAGGNFDFVVRCNVAAGFFEGVLFNINTGEDAFVEESSTPCDDTGGGGNDNLNAIQKGNYADHLVSVVTSPRIGFRIGNPALNALQRQNTAAAAPGGPGQAAALIGAGGAPQGQQTEKEACFDRVLQLRRLQERIDQQIAEKQEEFAEKQQEADRSIEFNRGIALQQEGVNEIQVDEAIEDLRDREQFLAEITVSENAAERIGGERVTRSDVGATIRQGQIRGARVGLGQDDGSERPPDVLPEGVQRRLGFFLGELEQVRAEIDSLLQRRNLLELEIIEEEKRCEEASETERVSDASDNNAIEELQARLDQQIAEKQEEFAEKQREADRSIEFNRGIALQQEGVNEIQVDEAIENIRDREQFLAEITVSENAAELIGDERATPAEAGINIRQGQIRGPRVGLGQDDGSEGAPDVLPEGVQRRLGFFLGELEQVRAEIDSLLERRNALELEKVDNPDLFPPAELDSLDRLFLFPLDNDASVNESEPAIELNEGGNTQVNSSSFHPQTLPPALTFNLAANPTPGGGSGSAVVTGETNGRSWAVALSGGVSSHRDGRAGADLDSETVSIGLSGALQVDAATSLGVSLNYAASETRSDDLQSDLDTDAFSISLSGGRSLSDAVSLSGSLGYSRGENDIDIVGDTGSFATDALSASLSLSATIPYEGWTLSPTASVSLANVWREGYTDSAGDAVPDSQFLSGAVSGGVSASRTFRNVGPFESLTPSLNLSTGYAFNDQNSQFATGGQSEDDGLGANLGLGLGFGLGQGVSGSVGASYAAFLEDVDQWSLNASVSIPLN